MRHGLIMLLLAAALGGAGCADTATAPAHAQAQAPAASSPPKGSAHEAAAPAGEGGALRILGEWSIPSGTDVLGTRLGGISGIDYDPDHDRYLLISDDRSTYAPARAYSARITLTAQGLQPPQWLQVHTLLHASGQPYARGIAAQRGVDVPDPEAVRWLPGGQQFVWTSEGDFVRGFGPRLRVNSVDGSAVRDIPLPAAFEPSPDRRRGPRNNGTLEGLAVVPGSRTAWLAMELPWVQDGPLPTHARPGGPVRITALDLLTGAPLRQIAYQPDAVHQPRALPVGPETVGVAEILADGEHHLLVLERSYSAGAGFSVRLYRVDTRSGSDTLELAQLEPGNHTPARKALVADFGATGIARVDNLEGMTWGPGLPGGGRMLLFVSDDNFNPAQVTQFIAAEYIPPPAAR